MESNHQSLLTASEVRAILRVGETAPDPVSLALAAMLREVARRRAEARARLRTVKEAA